MESIDKCKLCGASLNIEGYLNKCTSDQCNAVYWSKKLFSSKKKFFDIIEKKSEKKKHLNFEFKKLLDDAKISPFSPNQYYVYQIKLRKSDQNIKLKNTIKNDPKNLSNLSYQFYVGKTGTHPYERYLKHFIGYQSGIKLVYRYGIALVNYEGPMKSDEASKREEELANYLRSQGFTVRQN